MARKPMWPVLHKAMCTRASQVTDTASALNDIKTPVIHPHRTSFHRLILGHTLEPMDHQTTHFNTARQTETLHWAEAKWPSQVVLYFLMLWSRGSDGSLNERTILNENNPMKNWNISIKSISWLRLNLVSLQDLTELAIADHEVKSLHFGAHYTRGQLVTLRCRFSNADGWMERDGGGHNVKFSPADDTIPVLQAATSEVGYLKHFKAI